MFPLYALFACFLFAFHAPIITAGPIEDDEQDISEEFEQEQVTGTHGLVKDIVDNSSSVLNVDAGVQKRTFVSVAKGGDVVVELDGKYRVDMFNYGVNTKLLNDCNNSPFSLDRFIIPGKHTADIGFGIGYGAFTYGHEVVTLGVDLRNRLIWGKADASSFTSSTSIKDNEYVFGAHRHQLGVPVIFLRGADITIDLNAIYELYWCSQHYFKLGIFPFEVGRGISLGAAYAVTPDFITYDPIDTVQEYAPGFLFYGTLDAQKRLEYKAYLAIISNKSGSFVDVNERTNAQIYNRRFNGARGFGKVGLLSAVVLDWKVCNEDDNKVNISPYIVMARNPEETVDFSGDAHSLLGTFGIGSESACGAHEFGWEIAKNYGRQRVEGIDRNVVSREARNQVPTLQGVPVLVNSNVDFTGSNTANDVTNKHAVYLEGDARQTAIFGVFPAQTSNGQPISGFPLANASDRFRDPYCNLLDGWMAVLDYSYKFCLCQNPVTASLAVGMASGDDNPNKALEESDDYAEDGTYKGFIGHQEIYTGKRVKSIFLLSGVGKIPRILSVPGRTPAAASSSASIGYPSLINRFTNIAYTGGAVEWKFHSQHFVYKLNPNLLCYWQPVAPVIYDPIFAKKLGKNCISNFLGTEINMFVEAKLEKIDGLTMYGAITWFVPGSYYKDITGLPLDKRQQKFLDSFDASGNVLDFVPTVGHNTAFFVMFGVEYRF